MNIPALELLGYLGAALVFATFYLKTLIRLRLLAIASNVVFIAYAEMGHMLPILVLHLLLLPLNTWRLMEIRQLIKRVRQSNQASIGAPELLVPFMRKVRIGKGQTLFQRGDRADCVYYLFEGSVRLPGKDIVIGSGQMIGIVGIFSEEHRRTDSALCLSDVELGVISKDRILELFYQSPEFGALLVRMVARRAALDSINHGNSRKTDGRPQRIWHAAPDIALPLQQN